MRDELHALQPAMATGRELGTIDLRSTEIGNCCNEAQTETSSRGAEYPVHWPYQRVCDAARGESWPAAGALLAKWRIMRRDCGIELRFPPPKRPPSLACRPLSGFYGTL
jgi:hypothetical protein